MYLNAFRIRLSLMIAGGLVVGIYFLAGGSLRPGSKSVILIEYGMYPREFDGLEVLIDGEPAGRLQRFGSAFKTGFQVEDGDHIIELVHPEYRCEPARVTSGMGGRTVLLIPDFQQVSTASGESETVLILTY